MLTLTAKKITSDVCQNGMEQVRYTTYAVMASGTAIHYQREVQVGTMIVHRFFQGERMTRETFTTTMKYDTIGCIERTLPVVKDLKHMLQIIRADVEDTDDMISFAEEDAEDYAERRSVAQAEARLH